MIAAKALEYILSWKNLAILEGDRTSVAGVRAAPERFSTLNEIINMTYRKQKKITFMGVRIRLIWINFGRESWIMTDIEYIRGTYIT